MFLFVGIQQLKELCQQIQHVVLILPMASRETWLSVFFSSFPTSRLTQFSARIGEGCQAHLEHLSFDEFIKRRSDPTWPFFKGEERYISKLFDIFLRCLEDGQGHGDMWRALDWLLAWQFWKERFLVTALRQKMKRLLAFANNCSSHQCLNRNIIVSCKS